MGAIIAGILVPLLNLLYNVTAIVNDVLKYSADLINYAASQDPHTFNDGASIYGSINSTIEEYCRFLNRTLETLRKAPQILWGDHHDMIERLADEARRLGCPSALKTDGGVTAGTG